MDSSAIVAVARGEDGHEQLLRALSVETCLIPAPVITEFRLVISREGNAPDLEAEAIFAELLKGPLSIEPYTSADAEYSFAAIERYGRGNGQGGKLNLLDLMVYGMAKRTGRPILCTGRDFASTDAEIHPASRIG